MEIAYANRVWKSYTGARFGNFDSAELLEIAHGNGVWKSGASASAQCPADAGVGSLASPRESAAAFGTEALYVGRGLGEFLGA